MVTSALAFPLSLLATIHLATLVLNTILRLEADAVPHVFREAVARFDDSTCQRAAFVMAMPHLTYPAVFQLRGGAVWVTWGFYILTLRLASACVLVSSLLEAYPGKQIDATLTIVQRMLATLFLSSQALLRPQDEPSSTALWYLERLYAWNLVSYVVFPAGPLEAVYAVLSLACLTLLCGSALRHQPALAERMPSILLKEAGSIAIILATEAWRRRRCRYRRAGAVGMGAVGAGLGRGGDGRLATGADGAVAAAAGVGLRLGGRPLCGGESCKADFVGQEEEEEEEAGSAAVVAVTEVEGKQLRRLALPVQQGQQPQQQQRQEQQQQEQRSRPLSGSSGQDAPAASAASERRGPVAAAGAGTPAGGSTPAGLHDAAGTAVGATAVAVRAVELTVGMPRGTSTPVVPLRPLQARLLELHARGGSLAAAAARAAAAAAAAAATGDSAAAAALQSQAAGLRRAEQCLRRLLQQQLQDMAGAAGAAAASPGVTVDVDGGSAAAGLAAAAASPSPRPPVRRYVPLTRLCCTRVKIHGSAPELIAAGYRERIAEAVAAAGGQLEGVYVRRGCIELVIDVRQMMLAGRAEESASASLGDYPLVGSVSGGICATEVGGEGGGGGGEVYGGGGGDGDESFDWEGQLGRGDGRLAAVGCHGCYGGGDVADGDCCGGGGSVDIGTIIRALQLPFEVLYDSSDGEGGGGVDAVDGVFSPADGEGGIGIVGGNCAPSGSAEAVTPDVAATATAASPGAVDGSWPASAVVVATGTATAPPSLVEQPNTAAGRAPRTPPHVVSVRVLGPAAAAADECGRPSIALLSTRAIPAAVVGTTPSEEEHRRLPTHGGGTAAAAAAVAAIGTDPLELSVLLWSPDPPPPPPPQQQQQQELHQEQQPQFCQPLELCVRSLDRHLPVTHGSVVTWRPAAGGGRGGDGCSTTDGGGGEGYLVSVRIAVSALPPAPALLLLGLVDHHRRGGSSASSGGILGDGRSSGTGGESPVQGLAPVLLLDDPRLAEELSFGLVESFCCCCHSGGSGAASTDAVELRDLLSDLGCFLQHAAAVAAAAAPLARRAAALRRAQLCSLGLHLLEWFAAAGGEARWRLTLERLQAELVALWGAMDEAAAAEEAAAAAAEPAAVAEAGKAEVVARDPGVRPGRRQEPGSAASGRSCDQRGPGVSGSRGTVAVAATAAAARGQSTGDGDEDAVDVGAAAAADTDAADGTDGAGAAAATACGGGSCACPDADADALRDAAAAAAEEDDGAGAGGASEPRASRGSVWRWLAGWLGAVRSFFASLEEPEYQSCLRNYIQSQMQPTDLFVTVSVLGQALRSWQQEPVWRLRPLTAFAVHQSALAVLALPHLAQVAVYVTLPRGRWGAAGQALQAPRMAAYILSNLLVGYLGFDLPAGASAYHRTKAVWLGDALALGASVLVMPATAAALSALRIPTHIAMWRAIGVPFSPRHLRLRAVGLAALTTASNLAFHACLRLSLSRSAARRRRGGGGVVDGGGVGGAGERRSGARGAAAAAAAAVGTAATAMAAPAGAAPGAAASGAVTAQKRPKQA